MITCPAPNPPGARIAGRSARRTTSRDARFLPVRSYITLAVETSLAPGREIVQGVARYARDRGGWSLAFEPRRLDEVHSNPLAAHPSHGIIARVHTPRVAKSLLAARLPVVDVLGSLAIPGLPLVHTDDRRISQLAAEHLIERSFRHFAFVGLPGETWSARRRDAFAQAVAPASRSFHTIDSTDPDALLPWVASLPKPVGIMLCSDQLGPAVLDACRRAGLHVPDEVAVIGVDDDEPLCAVCDPALSSVWPDHSQVGYEAARLLDRLMAGHPAPVTPIFVPPRGVVTRGSTDTAAAADPSVATAVRLIRASACDPDGLTIDDLAAKVSISRTLLQRRFRQATGRTLHDEMLRVRLDRARTLLTDTDLPIAAVATAAGFRHQEYMGAVFRQKLGITPARYRRAART